MGRPNALAPRLFLLALGLAPLSTGCRLAGPSEGALPPGPVISGPALRAGASDPGTAAEVARLLAEGTELLNQGRFAEARDRGREIETRFATTEGSALALLLGARASMGLEEWTAADNALGTFMPLFPAGDVRIGEALLLRAEVRWEGELGGALEALFQIPPGSREELLNAAEARAASWAVAVETQALHDLVNQAPSHPRLLPVFILELGVRRHLAGAEAEALGLAEQALSLDPGERTEARARSLLAGTLDAELNVAAVIGAILPESGSPSVRELAQEIREGIEVALVVEEEATDLRVRFVAMNEQGTLSGVAEAISALESQGVAGVVGPLEEASLGAAARSRSEPLAILSPTVRMVPDAGPGVFSLTGVDPEAGRALAALVFQQGIRQVVLLHPTSAEILEEVRWFREAYLAGGGTIVRTLTYPVGATSLAAPLGEVASLAPRGLVLILSQQDIETLAPQLSFYGVNTIAGLTIFGNEAWVSQSVLQVVPPRHTDGILSVTTWVQEGEFGPGWTDFVQAYEAHFRRTLRSPVSALGYDSARLLLRAARAGGGTPAGTLRAFQEIRDFEGATGVLSVVDGRVRRSYQPVRLENRRVIPLTP
ncbi:MAG: ABC transporter substrate-binding protein [Gemmatimonadota bacterium]